MGWSVTADFMTDTVDSLVLKESDIAFMRARLVQLGEGEHRAALARMKKVEAASGLAGVTACSTC